MSRCFFDFAGIYIEFGSVLRYNIIIEYMDVDIMNVIFDMDGVIFDSERAYIDAYIKLAPKYGLADVRQACIESIGVTRDVTKQIFFRYHGGDFDFAAYREDVQRELSSRSFDIKPGVFELFDWLKSVGAKIALASSTRRISVDRMLSDAGLTEYFDAIVCGDMVSRSKPHPEIFLKAAERIKADPGSCYVIEDSYNGIRAARAAGTHPVMVPDIVQPDEEIRELAEIVLPSLFEVREYLEAVDQR